MIKKPSAWLISIALAVAVVYVLTLFNYAPDERVEVRIVRDTVSDTVAQVDTIAPTPRIEAVETINLESGPVMIVEDSTGQSYACYP